VKEYKDFLDEKVANYLFLFFNHMPNVDDEMVSILKGHLLIEKQLRELIQLESKKPKALADARLSFHQVLCLAESYYWYKGSEWLWSGIKKL